MHYMKTRELNPLCDEDYNDADDDDDDDDDDDEEEEEG